MLTAYANGILFEGTYYVAQALNGAGTVGNPYIIATDDDWETFVYNVNNGFNNYNGEYVRLDESISVSTMVGTSDDRSFQGTFLGDGVHTLTFTKGSSESAFNEEYCAPFRYVKNATIKNLKVAGDIYTSRKFAAGLVAQPSGTTNITNCIVSIIIHSNVNGDGRHLHLTEVRRRTRRSQFWYDDHHQLPDWHRHPQQLPRRRHPRRYCGHAGRQHDNEHHRLRI